MVLKRKRSESEFSASSSTFSSPQRPFESGFSTMNLDFSSMPTMPTPMRAVAAVSSHLPGRTMKRFRDSRPPAEIIHQRTLDILYSAAAQKHHPHEPTPTPTSRSSHEDRMDDGSQAQHQHQHQASLHSFWKLPPTNPAAMATATSSIPAPRHAPTSCEDCGGPLVASGDGNGDADADGDAMMDLDDDLGGSGDAAEEVSCDACTKFVCSHCSITKPGERRRCLGCAGNSSGGGNSSAKAGLRAWGWWSAAPPAAGVGVC